ARHRLARGGRQSRSGRSERSARRMTAPDLQGDTLDIEGLGIAYRVRRSDRQIVRDVSFRIGRGEAYGLVGESGCGKSTIALAIVRYLARNGRVTAGRIHVAGRDLLSLGKEELR